MPDTTETILYCIWIDGPQYTEDKKIAGEYDNEPQEGVFIPMEQRLKEKKELEEARAASAAARAALSNLTRRFPIQGGPSIPWWIIAPHEKQALRNHGGQTLERLAERGGLGPSEALAVLEDREFPWGDWGKERERADYNKFCSMVEKMDKLEIEKLKQINP